MKQIAALLISAAMLASCVTAETVSLPTLQPGDDYVALGSSFAAGAGIGALQPGSPERCGRTVNNYASLLAARLRLDLTDASCGGAMTQHLLGPWSELPPQLDAVTADTDLVTITIGGNDLDYVRNLFVASCAMGKFGTPVDQCPATMLPSDSDYAEVKGRLTAVVDTIRARAPGGRIAFVQYVTLVPETPCDAVPLRAEDAADMRALGRRLADITRQVATETGSLLIESDKASVGHTACDAEPWSYAMASGMQQAEGSPWHPNARGHEVIADMLQNILGG